MPDPRAFSVGFVGLLGGDTPTKPTHHDRSWRCVVPALAVSALLLAGCGTAESRTVATTSDASSGAPSSSADRSSSAPSPGATPTDSSPSASPPPSSVTATSTAGSDGTATSAEHRDPASIHVLVNKKNPLRPVDWAPSDLTVPAVPATRDGLTLRAEATEAAEDLFAAAAADGVELSLVSAYRSHGYQQGTYAGWVDRHGQSGADRISARPGYSEHQTGLAMDVGAADGDCTLKTCFADTPAGQWVADHAAGHGWIVRYPDGAEDVTGYSHEPWHLRYLGAAAAADVVRSGGILETAWSVAPAPAYGP